MTMPQELRERVPHEPTLWARNFLRHPEDPTRAYDFYDAEQEEFLHYLVDDSGPMNPENWGNVNVLLFARGCLKTFTCTTLLTWAIDCYPTIECAATAPRDDQRYEVVERFKQKVEQSGLDEKRSKNKLSYQQFKHTITDETGNKHTSYAELKSRSAWGEGDALRGIHGHIGVIDESQDVDEGTFSAFATEAIDRSVPGVNYFPSIFVIGTPKMANTFFNKLWDMADKQSWNEDSTEWEDIGDGQVFLPQPLKERKEELNERIDELEELDSDNEQLISELEEERDSLEGFTVKGWHLDQPNSPLHGQTEIAFKKETYSKKKYENEVLANFYSPENDLITNDDVWKNFIDERGWQSSRRYDDSTVVLGVDWGGGEGEGAASTVVGVAEVTEDTIDVLNLDVLDSSLSFSDEVERIDTYMDQYEVDVAVVDEGYGDSERQQLQDKYGHDNLYGCWFGNVKEKEEVKWNRFKNQKRFFTANKTYMVRKFSESFKNGVFSIPKEDLSFGSRRDLGTRIVDELTAPYTDRDETQSGKKKLKVISDRRDDIFDVFVYLWVAANKVQGTRTVREVGSHSMPGH